MNNTLTIQDSEKNFKVVFTHTEYDAEKIGLICERDRLFQQYIDLVKSIDAWKAKLPKKGNNSDPDEDYNLRRNRRRVLDNLEMNKKLISIELLKLDEEISPVKLVQDENN